MKSNKKNSKGSKKNNKSNKTVTPKSPKAKKVHAGRPSYEVKWPRGKFTFNDLMVLNGVDPETGKGPNCAKLTLVNHLKKDLARKGHSTIVKLDELAPPANGKLGRKQFVFQKRVQATDKQDKGSVKETVTVDVSKETKDYEAQKAALLAPDPVVAPVVVVDEAHSGTVSTTPEITPILEPVVNITPVADVVETAKETPSGDVSVSVAETPAVEVPAEAAPVNS